MGPSIAHLHMKSDKTVPGFVPVICNRLYKSALHFVSTWGRSHPPSHFGSCRVVTGTLKIDPRQMNHIAIAVSCWACRCGSRRISAKEVHFDVLNPFGETKVPRIGLSRLCADGVYEPQPAVPCGECCGGARQYFPHKFSPSGVKIYELNDSTSGLCGYL
jgi:hypothetical protein